MRDQHSGRRAPTLVAPSDGELSRLSKLFGLTPEQARELKIVVAHIVQDLGMFQAWAEQRPARSDLVARLKRIEKQLGDLKRTLSVRPDDVTALMPRGVEDFLAAALTAEILGELLGQDLSQTAEPRREALALKHSGPLLAGLVEALHRPFERWLEFDRRNTGGRPADRPRRIVIAEVAEAAPDILGRTAAVAQDGPFARLCNEVVTMLGLDTSGLEKLIPRVVKDLRDQDA